MYVASNVIAAQLERLSSLYNGDNRFRLWKVVMKADKLDVLRRPDNTPHYRGEYSDVLFIVTTSRKQAERVANAVCSFGMMERGLNGVRLRNSWVVMYHIFHRAKQLRNYGFKLSPAAVATKETPETVNGSNRSVLRGLACQSWIFDEPGSEIEWLDVKIPRLIRSE